MDAFHKVGSSLVNTNDALGRLVLTNADAHAMNTTFLSHSVIESGVG